MPLIAGTAETDMTPAAGVPLMGYGARQGAATGVHDPICARALYLADRDGDGAGAVLLVAADVCLMGTEQALEVRQALAARTELAPEQILLSSTHTHSGPDTGLAEHNAGKPLPGHCPALFEAMTRAGADAVAAARPARAGWTRAEAPIGRNRRIAEGPLDAGILVLRVDAADGAPLAVLFSHGCHGTVLGHDNLEISADWPGAAVERIRAETGAHAMFLLGAHADVDPRTRGLMDLAIPGQSVGLGFDAVRVLGHEVAEAVLGSLDGARPEAELAVGARARREHLPLHLGDLPADDARSALEARRRQLAQQLGVASEDLPRLSRLLPEVEQRARQLPLAQARRLLSAARLYHRDKTGPFFTGGARALDVEAQVLRIGDCALLGLPLEPTTNVGLDWRARAQRRLALAGVCGIANGWLRYLPHPADLAHPRAHEHYEVLMSTLAPGACERLLDTGEELLDSLL